MNGPRKMLLDAFAMIAAFAFPEGLAPDNDDDSDDDDQSSDDD